MRSIEAAPGAGAEFVSEADWIPGFWNFLLGLDAADLIPELVQNDLDQQATRTIISFERDRLICEGNGAPVDPDGWRRLRMISGAGHSVPAKVGKIGVKNYGLKAAFTVGDEVQLLSDGQSITQPSPSTPTVRIDHRGQGHRRNPPVIAAPPRSAAE